MNSVKSDLQQGSWLSFREALLQCKIEIDAQISSGVLELVIIRSSYLTQVFQHFSGNL